MHIGVRAARDQRARKRILASAEALAERFGLTPPPTVQGRDKVTGAVLEREGLAEFLEALIAALDECQAIAEVEDGLNRDELRERLLGIKGIGAALADQILAVLDGADGG